MIFIPTRNDCACSCHRQWMHDDAECSSQRVFGVQMPCCYDPRGSGFLEQEDLQRMFFPDMWRHYVETGHDLMLRSDDRRERQHSYDLSEFYKLRAETDDWWAKRARKLERERGHGRAG